MLYRESVRYVNKPMHTWMQMHVQAQVAERCGSEGARARLPSLSQLHLQWRPAQCRPGRRYLSHPVCRAERPGQTPALAWSRVLARRLPSTDYLGTWKVRSPSPSTLFQVLLSTTQRASGPCTPRTPTVGDPPGPPQSIDPGPSSIPFFETAPEAGLRAAPVSQSLAAMFLLPTLVVSPFSPSA